MKLLVGIDGAQGTGKSTLISALKDHFGSRLGYVPEAARIIAPTFGVNCSSDWARLLADKPSLEQFFDAEERWIVSRQRAEGHLVIDSSLWVVAAYRQHFNCRSGLAPAREAKYDALLHCGVTEAAKTDGFRFTTGQAEVDAIYRALVAESYDGLTVTLPAGLERIDAAIAAVELLLARAATDGAA